MLDDKTRAFLGDSAAQERLTVAGVLLPCPCCGAQPKQFGGASISYVHCDKCGLEVCRMDSDGEDIVEKIFAYSPKYEAHLAWNRRAAILTLEQLDALVAGLAVDETKGGQHGE